MRAAALLVLLPLAAGAQDLEGAVAACAGIESRLDRLDCYDRLPGAFGISAGQSDWAVEQGTDPLNGTPLVTLTLTAREGRAAFGAPIRLVAHCRNDTTEVFVQWSSFLGAVQATQPVTLRIGEGAPEAAQWVLSDDREATFTPDWGGTLLRRLADGPQLVIETVPYDGDPLRAVFDTSGLAEAVQPLTEACNWSL